MSMFIKILFGPKKNLNKQNAIPKNRLKKAGIKMIASGIKNLKFGSYKSERGIQYIQEIKYPNPKTNP